MNFCSPLSVLADEATLPSDNSLKVYQLNDKEYYTQYVLSLPITSTSTAFFLVDQYMYIPASTTKVVAVVDMEVPEEMFKDFLSPVGQIASVSSTSTATTTIYSGYVVDTTYAPLPVLGQSSLNYVSYPFISSTSTLATSTINLLSVSTTTQYTVYSPFQNYTSSSLGLVSTYFTLNGVLVGAYTYQVGNEAATGKISYSLSSYLGTPVLETDDKGDIVEADMTDVFGNYIYRDQRVDNALHTKGYTGHEYDDTTGNIYAHSRFLNSSMHSFMSVDPLNYSLPQEYLLDPQQLNTYSYARNNSVINLDPNGQSVKTGLIGAGQSLGGAIVPTFVGGVVIAGAVATGVVSAPVLTTFAVAGLAVGSLSVAINSVKIYQDYSNGLISADERDRRIGGVTMDTALLSAGGKGVTSFAKLGEIYNAARTSQMMLPFLDGHAIEQHVGKTVNELIGRGIENSSSYFSLETMYNSTNATIKANQAQIQSWSKNAKVGATQNFTFDLQKPIGVNVSKSGQTSIITTANVVLKKTISGYNVLTSYPKGK